MWKGKKGTLWKNYGFYDEIEEGRALNFVGLVKQWLESYLFRGTPSFVLTSKLKALIFNFFFCLSKGV
jgi:hypothetical protein